MANYKIYGTNKSWTGKVVTIGDSIYTTVGGTLEGNSYQVVEVMAGKDNRNLDLPTIDSMNQSQLISTDASQNQNPITRLFSATSSPRYRRSDNNQLIPVGANLHEHQDGTIMTEHSMGPNDNSVIVTTQRGGTSTTTAPDTQTGGGSGGY